MEQAGLHYINFLLSLKPTFPSCPLYLILPYDQSHELTRDAPILFFSLVAHIPLSPSYAAQIW